METVALIFHVDIILSLMNLSEIFLQRTKSQGRYIAGTIRYPDRTDGSIESHQCTIFASICVTYLPLGISQIWLFAKSNVAFQRKFIRQF